MAIVPPTKVSETPIASEPMIPRDLKYFDLQMNPPHKPKLRRRDIHPDFMFVVQLPKMALHANL